MQLAIFVAVFGPVDHKAKGTRDIPLGYKSIHLTLTAAKCFRSLNIEDIGDATRTAPPGHRSK